MLRPVTTAAAAAAALMSSHVAAQGTALPPVRPIGATTAQATVPLTMITWVVPVGGGRVLIDERAQLRLSLLDSTPKLQQHWVRLSDSAKEAIVDSVRQWNEGHRYTKTNVSNDGVLTRYQGRPDRVPDADQLPDYPAPFGGGAVRADADGNVWVLRGAVGPLGAGGTSGMSDSPLLPAPRDVNNVVPKVYDVVNRHGVIFDRVELPGGTSIIGFGPGVVYLSGRITSKYQVVRVRIR